MVTSNILLNMNADAIRNVEEIHWSWYKDIKLTRTIFKSYLCLPRKHMAYPSHEVIYIK